MKRVILESPYKPCEKDIKELIECNHSLDRDLAFKIILERNKMYLRLAMHDCIVNYKESPYASHGLYTQKGVLDDENPEERELGINAGFLWREVANHTVVYTNYGISTGMKYGITHAGSLGQHIEYRTLDLENHKYKIESL